MGNGSAHGSWHLRIRFRSRPATPPVLSLIRTEKELAIDPFPLVLELSDRHLPPDLPDALAAMTGLTVSWTAVGVLLHVPAHHQLPHTLRHCPADMAAILRYAHSLGCDFVLIGPDADVDQTLPVWDR
jgi:hypothetical protein